MMFQGLSLFGFITLISVSVQSFTVVKQSMFSVLYILLCIQGNWCLPWERKCGLLLFAFWRINCIRKFVLPNYNNNMDFWIVRVSRLQVEAERTTCLQRFDSHYDDNINVDAIRTMESKCLFSVQDEICLFLILWRSAIFSSSN